MKSYSLDFRERILQAALSGTYTYQQVADLYSVGRATVVRIVSRYRKEGHVRTYPQCGHRPLRLPPSGLEKIREFLMKDPSLRIQDIQKKLQEHGYPRVSKSALHRYMQRLGFRYKKKVYTYP